MVHRCHAGEIPNALFLHSHEGLIERRAHGTTTATSEAIKRSHGQYDQNSQREYQISFHVQPSMSSFPQDTQYTRFPCNLQDVPFADASSVALPG